MIKNHGFFMGAAAPIADYLAPPLTVIVLISLSTQSCSIAQIHGGSAQLDPKDPPTETEIQFSFFQTNFILWSIPKKLQCTTGK